VLSITAMASVAGVQIVDICIATRSLNGGLIDLLELRKLPWQKRKTDIA
jgi:ESCRT-II complex subunit VPS22